jgi:hypothetical protein
MAHKLKYLRIEFDEKIAGHEIPQFRGALIDKVGKENILFHNHLDDKVYQYGYPLIQYKIVHHRPTLLCLHKGTEEIHHFFSQPQWNLQLHDRELQMKIAQLEMKEYTLNVWDRFFSYRISQWLALDETSYEAYQKLEDEISRIHTLQTKLCGNILSFAKGISWQLPDKETNPVKCRITSPIKQQTVKFKQTSLLAFQLNFETNVFLPPYIGLGKSPSRGYGLVESLRA